MSNIITQIAVCTTDLYRSIVFYDQVVGMDAISGTVAFRGQIAETIQQLPNPASKVRWLIDDSFQFQLEIFAFEQPQPKLLPKDYGVSYEGYNHLIVAITSIERFQRDMFLLGFYQPVEIIEGDHNRHAVTTDPDGIILHLVEKPELVDANRSGKLIGLGLTTSQFDTCVSDFIDYFSLTTAEDLFETSLVWAGKGELKNTATLRLHDKFLVINEFDQSIPRKDYRLCDVGVMNFAVGYPDFTSWRSAILTGQSAGIEHSVVPSDSSASEGIGGTYAISQTGLSVEMLYCAEEMFGSWGWAVPSDADREFMYQFSVNQIAGYKPTPAG